MSSHIHVRGAREHNLKNIDVSIPRDALTVITGPSGSGKSSLAIDTIYAEGRRRYLESLSAYARQMLGPLPRPDVDAIDGLSPSICVEQAGASRSPRSTVGTMTEVLDYLRLIYARAGVVHCPSCGARIEAQTVAHMMDMLFAREEGTRFTVLAPVVREASVDVVATLERYRRDGFVRATLDGAVIDLGDAVTASKRKTHDIDIHIDRLVLRADARQRIREAIELALSLADGLVRIAFADETTLLFSEKLRCTQCGTVLPSLTPQLFSFNSPEGACPDCHGVGERRVVRVARAVDPVRSLRQGAVLAWGVADGAFAKKQLENAAKIKDLDLGVAFGTLPEAQRNAVLFGDAKAHFEGVVPWIERRLAELETRADDTDEAGAVQEDLASDLRALTEMQACSTCDGTRLRKEALAVRFAGHTLGELCALPLSGALSVLVSASLDDASRPIVERPLRDVDARLSFLVDVGLGYLALNRASDTLSGGEMQRLRLATELGGGLSGVLYVLDEPSIGLHPRDTARLVASLKRLRDQGNAMLVVDHDLDVLTQADFIVELGPRAGKEGGHLVATDTPAALAAAAQTPTGKALSRGPFVRAHVPRVSSDALQLRGVTRHSLRDVDVDIPKRVLTAVTGVSGSGKSTLILEVLLPLLRAHLRGHDLADAEARLVNVGDIGRVISVEQSPIGRSSRSTPATFTGIFAPLRELFASLPDARARGYKASRFSYNVKGGRCETCLGEGTLSVEMRFLPDVSVPCPECHGKRYHAETLDVRYRGLSIADVLALSVQDAHEIFSAIPKINAPLEALISVGLGYLQLGQSASTLSGGEAQRIRLAKELARRKDVPTLYVFDEPTNGLHVDDIRELIAIFDQLVDGGHTVIVIEHDLDVIASADYVIDLGPEGGPDGGRVVATGAPTTLARDSSTHTAKHLARWLGIQ